MAKIIIEHVAEKTWLVPTFGNVNPNPTGRLEIWYRYGNGDLIVVEKTMREPSRWSHIDDYYQYVTIERKRFMVKNIGSLYCPKFQLIQMRKCGKSWVIDQPSNN